MQRMAMTRIQGFSLPELLVALAVVAILVSLAAPNIRFMLVDRRMAAWSQQLHNSIMLARSEAINRGVPVSLCRAAGDNPRQCADSEHYSGHYSDQNWASGWLVFVDSDSDGRQEPWEPLIRSYARLPERISLNWNQGAYLRFNSQGQAREAGRFTLCESAPDSIIARAIVVSLTGRIRVITLERC